MYRIDFEEDSDNLDLASMHGAAVEPLPMIVSHDYMWSDIHVRAVA